MTGERPKPGATPDSLLALHAAGYREVRDRLGRGRVLDAGCGLGFESIGLRAEERDVTGIDYDPATSIQASREWRSQGLRVGCMDAAGMGLRSGSVDYACSSHLVEHFWHPEHHVGEMSRVLRSTGTAFFLTPNRTADFENPFHLVLFAQDEFRELLSRYFGEVWVGALEATARVKADLAARRAKADRLLRLDVFDLRHRMPRSWYVAAYTRALPVAYRLLARADSGGATGITADDFFVADEVDDATPVLFAVASEPRHAC